MELTISAKAEIKKTKIVIGNGHMLEINSNIGKRLRSLFCIQR